MPVREPGLRSPFRVHVLLLVLRDRLILLRYQLETPESPSGMAGMEEQVDLVVPVNTVVPLRKE